MDLSNADVQPEPVLTTKCFCLMIMKYDALRLLYFQSLPSPEVACTEPRGVQKHGGFFSKKPI
jgi:hypothetical protein